MRGHIAARLWPVLFVVLVGCGSSATPPTSGRDVQTAGDAAGADGSGTTDAAADTLAEDVAADAPDASTQDGSDTAADVAPPLDAVESDAVESDAVESDGVESDAAGSDATSSTDAIADAGEPDVAEIDAAADAQETDAQDVAAQEVAEGTDALAVELPPECTVAADCDDEVPCTIDTCNSGACAHAANDAACDDGNLCTINVCDVSADCTATFATVACDDGNPCTADDSCKAGSCSGTKVACPGTVCGNGVVEQGEDCDLGGIDSSCCGKDSCMWLQTAPFAEVEPNNSAYGSGSLHSNSLASAPLATEMCGALVSGEVSPGWSQTGFDQDFYKIHVAKPGTVTLTTADPTGGTACVLTQNANNKWYYPIQTELRPYRLSSFGQVENLPQKNTTPPKNGCAAVEVEVVEAGWIYVGVAAGGQTAELVDTGAAYSLQVSQKPWVCGDGKRQVTESCEGTDLNNQSCVTIGYTSGTLSCTEQCGFDAGLCEGLPPGVEPNNSLAEATPMGSVVNGRFGGGIDYYAITVPQGSTLELTTSDPSGMGACGSSATGGYYPDLDTVLSLLGPNGEEIALNDDINKQWPPFPPGTNFCSTLRVEVPVGGTYYVRVQGHTYLKIPDTTVQWGYRLDATITPWTCAEQVSLPCEVTANQAPETAAPLQSAVQGVLLGAEGADYYTFTISEPSTAVRILLDDVAAGSCGTPLMPAVLELFGSDGTTLLGAGLAEDDSDGCPVLQTTLDAGTYVVRVRSLEASLAFAYRLFVSRGTSQWVTAAAGGTVTLPAGAAAAGASVLIPPGALYQDVTITVYDGTPVELADMAPQGPPVRFGPSGLGFVLPVTITLPTSTTETESMAVLHRNDATGEVTPQEVLEPVLPGFVTTLASSFSTFQPAKAMLPVLIWSGTVLEETADNNGTIAPLYVKILGGKFHPAVKSGQHNELFGTVVGGSGLGYCSLIAQYVGGTGVVWVNDTTAKITVWHVSPYHGSDYNLGPFSCEFTSQIGLGGGVFASPFVDALGNSVESKKVLGYKKTNLYLSYLDPPSVELSAKVFKQSKAADGTIGNKILVTIKGDKLLAPVGSELSAVVPGQSGKNRFGASLEGIGMKARNKVISPTQIELWIEGMHNAPLPESGGFPLPFTLVREDFKGQGMPWVNELDVSVDWTVKKLHWSRFVFHENATLNDGTVATESQLTLLGDQFAAAPGSVIGTGVGLPDGLQLQITVDTPTTATAKIVGTAVDPLDGDWDDWTQNGALSHTFGVTFADGDFVGGAAADVVRASRNDLELVLYAFEGFVYTGLPGGGRAELEAYDFGAGPRYLYWQPMLAEGGLKGPQSGSGQCKSGAGCELLNFGHEDRLAFKLTSGANPHGAQHGGNRTGCAIESGEGFGLSECTADKWYPVHTRSKIRGVGATQAIIANTTRHWQDFSPEGKILPPNPDRIGSWSPTPEGFVGSCGYNEVCCGFDNPFWIHHDVGFGIAGYKGPYGSWIPDPINFNDPWTPLAGWGWDFGSHPLVGGPTDKYELNWIGGNGMQLAITQQIQCPDVRLVDGKRVDLCEGTGYQFASLIYSADLLVGFPKSWTTNCDGPWANPASNCKPMFNYDTGHSACYGAPTGAPTGGNYPRFY